jgi:hypothetical protein
VGHLVRGEVRDVADGEGLLDRVAGDVEQAVADGPGVAVQGLRGAVLADDVVGEEPAVEEGVAVGEQQAADEGYGEREVAQGLGAEVDVRGGTPGEGGGGRQQEQRRGEQDVEAVAEGRDAAGAPVAPGGARQRNRGPSPDGYIGLTATIVTVRWTPSVVWILLTTISPSWFGFFASTKTTTSCRPVTARTSLMPWRRSARTTDPVFPAMQLINT